MTSSLKLKRIHSHNVRPRGAFTFTKVVVKTKPPTKESKHQTEKQWEESCQLTHYFTQSVAKFRVHLWQANNVISRYVILQSGSLGQATPWPLMVLATAVFALQTVFTILKLLSIYSTIPYFRVFFKKFRTWGCEPTLGGVPSHSWFSSLPSLRSRPS